MNAPCFAVRMCRLCLMGLLVSVLPACAAGSGSASYGTKVRFARGSVVSFPDFDLTFTGTRHVADPTYPRGFDFKDFTVSRGGKTKTISWSSGTGDIGPTEFAFEGGRFALELSMSGKLHRLANDELVMWKR